MRFIPCKILDRQWAEKLLDGEVFMRPLAQFGSWDTNSAITDSTRKDYTEGAVACYSNADQAPFLSGFDSAFKAVISRALLIDDSELQYFKLFCMYCMEVGEDNNLLQPDPRIRGFGDTVIAFRDFNSFLVRWGRALESKYEDWVDLLDRINYYSVNTNRMLVPLFEKSDEYRYQKELRLAFCRSVKFPEGSYRIALEKEAVTVNIGDIRDIAYAVPMDDFLSGRGIAGRHYFPETGNLNMPYDFMVNHTKEQMKTVKSYGGRVQVIIS